MQKYLNSVAKFNLVALGKLLAPAGVLVYLWQTLIYIRTSKGMLDEGLYLVKGWLFATHTFTPFQDYGPLTNHMPLAFLIPGYVLKWFGANLAVGRTYALVLGCAGLIALYFVSYRLAGKWWALFTLWATVLNVALVRIYSLALSQVLVGALLAFVLLLSIRRDLNHRHIFISGLLCGALLMVRINMFPFAILWAAYLFARDRKSFLLGLGGIALVVAGVHFLYWPNILRMWAYWIPEGMFKFLDPFYTPWDKYSGNDFFTDLGWLGNLDDPRWNAIISFWLAYRYNFVVTTAVSLCLVFWPNRKNWPDTFTFQTAVFLIASYFSLTLVHMWAALGGNSCHEFCFSGYMTFFNCVGLLALPLCFPHLKIKQHPLRMAIAALVLLVLAAGLGFSTSNTTGDVLSEISIPRLTSGEGFPLWGVFNNKWGVSYRDARKLVPALAGLAFGFALLLFFVVRKFKWPHKAGPPVFRAWLSFLLIGFLLSPTPLLSLGDKTLQCGGDILVAYDYLAGQLNRYVKPGDRLYYHGPNSPAILLSMPGVRFFPQQLNGSFSFNDEDPDANPDELLRFGYWNQEIKENWLQEADWVLVEERRFPEWRDIADTMDIVLITEPIEPCVGAGSRQILLKVSK